MAVLIRSARLWRSDTSCCDPYRTGRCWLHADCCGWFSHQSCPVLPGWAQLLAAEPWVCLISLVKAPWPCAWCGRSPTTLRGQASPAAHPTFSPSAILGSGPPWLFGLPPRLSVLGRGGCERDASLSPILGAQGFASCWLFAFPISPHPNQSP